MVKIGELGTVYSGGTPSRSNSSYWGRGIKWLAISDYSDFSLVQETKEQITLKGLNNSSAKIFDEGTVIISIFATLGRVAILGDKMATNQAIAGIKCNDSVNNRFLMYSLKSKLKEITDKSEGVAQKNINLNILKNLQVQLPPLNIQEGIVDMLDRAYLSSNQSRKIENELNALAQAMFLEMFGDPVCNSKRWPTKTLSQVVSISSGGTPSKSNDSYWQGNFPWVSPKDMKIDYLSDAIDHISDLVFEETNIKKVPEGTILVVVRGMILAHSLPLAMNLCDIAINQDIKALTVCDDGIDNEFLFHCLKNQKDHILSKVSTAAHGTKRLDTPDLLGLEIIMPPLDLQYKYVEIMRKNTQVLECYKQSSIANKQLFNSLMQRAFSGKLNLKKVA